jgi:5-methylcytosine-specific restriction endonuclease McrA
MTADFHRITVLDPDTRQGTCSVCGPIERLRRRERRGSTEWSCPRKHSSYAVAALRPHRQHVGPFCMECGFIATDPAQLDVHHLNGNHDDNRPENLATLCANCHRLFHAAGVDGLRHAAETRDAGHGVVTDDFFPVIRAYVRARMWDLTEDSIADLNRDAWVLTVARGSSTPGADLLSQITNGPAA